MYAWARIHTPDAHNHPRGGTTVSYPRGTTCISMLTYMYTAPPPLLPPPLSLPPTSLLPSSSLPLTSFSPPSFLGEGNPHHYFVASQDRDLRNKLREIPGMHVVISFQSLPQFNINHIYMLRTFVLHIGIKRMF